ncbi:hypothetical protein DSO57_1006045 [Entomophthora muscae]|uniref:Uncharacterized protein n=1 Tax=Entomophthora muscae TaxID=34485 RepID=A0ACC2U6H9_9FUNG|nr:hypothetical protein DSO57_1006045 [Entomophthora muscae]
MHFSLKDIASGGNAFAGDSNGISAIAEQFIAGVVVTFPSIMSILAPTINSYKHLVKNYWAPVKVSWGIENWLAAICVIAPPNCAPASTRIEVRVPGADINPCLVMLCILAAGHYGISQRLANPLNDLQMGESLAEYPGENLPKVSRPPPS